MARLGLRASATPWCGEGCAGDLPSAMEPRHLRHQLKVSASDADSAPSTIAWILGKAMIWVEFVSGSGQCSVSTLPHAGCRH
jgi:hypothetical protein